MAGSCYICQAKSNRIAAAIGICASCLRTRFLEARPVIDAAHAASRSEFNLPARSPRHKPGVHCKLCSNKCCIGEGERGFCGLRTVYQGKLIHLAGTPQRSLLHWYRDPLPTNCVADWVCEGRQHPGFHNLAVFYASCTAKCLFCQNWHFRQVSPTRSKTITASELASVANPRTFCACFFGGDPASQMPHALAAAKLLSQCGVRVCWETNGMMHPHEVRSSFSRKISSML